MESMERIIDNDYTKLCTAEEIGKPVLKCEICGKEKMYGRIHMCGKNIDIPVLMCDCAKKAQEEWEEQERKKKIKRNLDWLKANSHLPKAEKTFEEWVHTEATEECYKAYRSFVENYYKGSHGMLVYGDCGCGKSHLSIALATELAKQGVRTIYKNVPELFEDIYESFSGNGISASEIIRPITDASVVILDDLGAEKPTEFVRSKLYYIINSLYNSEATLIVTSNITKISDLKGIIGARSYDRIIEMCKFVHNTGTSYRVNIALERESTYR